MLFTGRRGGTGRNSPLSGRRRDGIGNLRLRRGGMEQMGSADPKVVGTGRELHPLRAKLTEREGITRTGPSSQDD